MAFRRTRESAEKFIEAVSCSSRNCETSSDLQFLGTSCKHPYCWGCVEKFNHMKIFPNCHLCGSLIEPACPKPAILHDNLVEDLLKFKELLIKYEAAVKREGANSSTQQMTQALFDRNFEEPPPLRTVDEFMGTQEHYDTFGLETSRPNTPETPNPTRKTVETPPSRRKSLGDIALPDVTPEKKWCPTKVVEPINQKERPVRISPLKTSFTGAAAKRSISSRKDKDGSRNYCTESDFPVLFQTQTLNQTVEDFDQTQQVVVSAFQSTNSFQFLENPVVPFVRKTKSHNAEARWKDSENVTPQLRKYSSDVPSISTLNTLQQPSTAALSPDFQNTSMEAITSISSQEGRRLSNVKLTERPVMQAVESGDTEKLKKVLRANYNPNEYCPIKGTPLYVAVGLQKRDMCQLLIEYGALINVLCGPTCNSPLHLAVEMNNEEIVKYLLSKGASKLDKNRLNQTAVELAATSSPMRSLVEKYRLYPRQPSVPPALPQHQYIFLDSKVHYPSADMRILNKWFHFRYNFDEQVTHFVVSLEDEVATASSDFMKALLSGVHIVSREWLDECLKRDVKITEDLKYEVQLARYKDGETAKGSAEKWRKKYEKLTPGIFRGCKFYLANPQYGSYGKRKIVSELILLCEGELLNKEPLATVPEPSPYFRKDQKMSPYFVVYDPAAPLPGLKLKDVNFVSVGWLFQCMLHFNLFTTY